VVKTISRSVQRSTRQDPQKAASGGTFLKPRRRLVCLGSYRWHNAVFKSKVSMPRLSVTFGVRFPTRVFHQVLGDQSRAVYKSVGAEKHICAILRRSGETRAEHVTAKCVVCTYAESGPLTERHCTKSNVAMQSYGTSACRMRLV
jgi:hypothetical protein